MKKENTSLDNLVVDFNNDKSVTDSIKPKLKPVDTIINESDIQEVVESTEEPVKKRRGGKGRKSKATIEAEAKEAKEAELLDQVFKTSMILAVINLTKIVSHYTKDEKWVAETDEATMIADSIVASLDYHFPNWKTVSPDLALITALAGYIAKRVV